MENICLHMIDANTCPRCKGIDALAASSGNSELLLRGSMLHDGMSQIVRWRDIKKEPPKANDTYIVLANDIVNEWQQVLDYCNGEWRDDFGEEFPAIVTHWMPLLQRPAQ